jgi:hypothetical protein
MIEFIDKATAVLDSNQMTALLYRELMLIDKDGSIRFPDTNDWWHLITGLGRHWFHPDSPCPNLLDGNVDWKRLIGGKPESEQ